MKREELAHILRAASAIVDDPNILVIGSQAILGSFHEGNLPEAATVSIEADIAFFDDPDNRKSDAVDGAIGELSNFHQLFSIYAQGVSVSTATLPSGWRERTVSFGYPGLPDSIVCLESHDLVIAKLAAAREKDLEFAGALIEAGLVRCPTLLARARSLEDPAVRERAVQTVSGLCPPEAGLSL